MLSDVDGDNALSSAEISQFNAKTFGEMLSAEDLENVRKMALIGDPAFVNSQKDVTFEGFTHWLTTLLLKNEAEVITIYFFGSFFLASILLKHDKFYPHFFNFNLNFNFNVNFLAFVDCAV